MAWLSKKALRRLAYVGGLFVVVAGLAAGLLMTASGRNLLADIAEAAASGPDFKLKIGTIGGPSPGSMTIDSIEIGDSRGTWLMAQDIALDWEPLALFSSKVAINSLSAGRITAKRRPDPSEEDTAGDESGTPFAVDVGAFDIARIELDQPVIGVPAALSAKGNARLADPGKGIEGNLDVKRLDAGGALMGRFVFRPSDKRLTTTLKASEPEGGLIVRTLGVEGLPPLSVDIDGDGSLDNWTAQIAATAGNTALARGTAEIRLIPSGRRLAFVLDTQVSPIAPAAVRPLVTGTSRLSVTALIAQDGRITVERGELQGAAIQADLSGVGHMDGRLDTASLNATIGVPDGRTLSFPGENGILASLQNATIAIKATPGSGNLKLVGEISAARLAAGDTAAQSAGIRFSADTDARLAEMVRQIAGYTLDIEAAGVSISGQDLTASLGSALKLNARGRIDNSRTEVTGATLITDAGTATLAGTLERGQIDGTFGLEAADLSRLSILIGQSMAGSLKMSGTARANLRSGDVSLNVDGTAEGLNTGSGVANKLAGQSLTLKGGLERNGPEWKFQALQLNGQYISAAIDGSVGGNTARLVAKGRLSDLSRVSDALGGTIDFDAGISGSRNQADVRAELTGTSISVRGKEFSSPVIRFNGSGPVATPAGKLAIMGAFAGRPVNGRGDVSVIGDGGVKLDNLDITYGKTEARGNLAFAPGSGLGGALSVRAADLGDFRDLTGLDLSGALNINATLASQDGDAVIRAKGIGRDIALDDIRLTRLDIDGAVNRLFSSPVADGTARAQGIRVNDVEIPRASVRAVADGRTTRAEVAARIRNLDVAAGGTVEIADKQVRIGLERASLEGPGLRGALAKPTNVLVEGGRARLNGATLGFGSGRAVIDGVAGNPLDLSVRLDGFPLSVANAFVPDLGAEGRISGTITAKGPAASAVGRYQLRIAAASVAASRDAGLSSLGADLSGALQDGRLTTSGTVRGPEGMALAVSGSAPAGADVPIDLTAKGKVPLALANPALATRGGSVSGLLDTSFTVSGTPDAPVIRGNFTTRGATLRDPESGITVTDIAARASMTDKAFTLQQFSGKTAKGGTITGTGRVGLDGAAGNPADIKITARNFHVEDGKLLTGTVDAELTVTGSVRLSPLLGGRVNIKRMDISVPDALPSSVRSFDVEHRNAAPAVRRQAEALKKKEEDERSLPVRLNLRVDAANRILVRGRGLDAVLGGGVGIAGTAESPVVDGAFRLQRGSLDILGRRMNFTRGNLDFTGDLEPDLDFAAETSTSSATVTVLVSGPASEPKFSFESSPELPEDEILSQLIFDQSVSDLSPLQIARLGGEVARLGGLSSGPGVLGELQQALGVDVLDLAGGGGVTAGRYLNEKAYLGVKQTGSDKGSAVIDLDITKQLKARGEFGSDGSSKIGIGVEWEY